MATGMYTSPERVVRDGRLVAFAGEVMTMDEAVTRGLVPLETEPEQEAQQEPAEENEAEPEQEAEAEAEPEPEQEPEAETKPAEEQKPARKTRKASK